MLPHPAQTPRKGNRGKANCPSELKVSRARGAKDRVTHRRLQSGPAEGRLIHCDAGGSPRSAARSRTRSAG